MGTIQPSIGLDRLADHRFDGGCLGDIHLDEGGFPTVFRDHMDGLVSTLFVHVSHNQFRPFPCKRQGCGSPNSRSPSRDESNFPFQTSWHGDPSCADL
jgi:hypothetical protein